MAAEVTALRWTLKKVTRYACAHGTSLLIRAASHARGRGDPRVRILTYHSFGRAPRAPFCLSPNDFVAQMRYVADAGLALSLPQFEAFLQGHANPQHDAVLVTIDDGLKCLRTAALPVLREFAIPAVAFVSAGLIGTSQNGEYLDWDDLLALKAADISVQSHGWSHRSLGYLTRDAILQELCASRVLLEERLGAEVTAFAYPFGTRADFSTAIASMVSEAGYRLAFTSQHGSITSCGFEPHMLPRIKVESGEPLATFRALVHGGLDAWGWIDRGLWQLQSSARA
jgi:peptidoglycan/xylan/chitin deacetylase (PgdA/CDA1 family)